MGGSIINAIRQEFSLLRSSPAGGMVRQGLEEAGKSFARPFTGIGQATRKYGEFMGSPMFERAGRTAERFWGEKAGIPTRPIKRSIWVTKEGPGAYRRAQAGASSDVTAPYRKPEGAPGGTTTDTGPGKTGISTATEAAKTRIVPGTTFRERLPETPKVEPPGVPKLYGGEQLGKYRDIARMSLEQWNRYSGGERVKGFEHLGTLPEGDRPIHTIRGTDQAWYSPKTSEEYATRAGSVTGIHGRQPSVADLMKREELEFTEKAKSERERFKGEKEVEKFIKGARTRGEYDLEAAKIRGAYDLQARQAAAKITGSERVSIGEWKVDKTTGSEGQEELVMWHDKLGPKSAVPIDQFGIGPLAGFMSRAGTEGAALSAEILRKIFRYDRAFAEKLMESINIVDPDVGAAISAYGHSRRKKKD
jgi:hypothetical protein